MRRAPIAHSLLSPPTQQSALATLGTVAPGEAAGVAATARAAVTAAGGPSCAPVSDGASPLTDFDTRVGPTLDALTAAGAAGDGDVSLGEERG